MTACFFQLARCLFGNPSAIGWPPCQGAIAIGGKDSVLFVSFGK